MTSTTTAHPAALLDDARTLLDTGHLEAVAELLVAAGYWDSRAEALDAAGDVLAASLVVAAEDDEED